jgi:hypothetical protein
MKKSDQLKVERTAKLDAPKCISEQRIKRYCTDEQNASLDGEIKEASKFVIPQSNALEAPKLTN